MMLRARAGRDEGEQAVVHRLAAARKAPKVLVELCRMVELSWDGWLVPQIADELRCSQKTVRRWLRRFNRSGLEGLEDLGRAGPQAKDHRGRTLPDHRTGQADPARPARGTAVEREVGRGRVAALGVDLGHTGRGGAGPGH
ncbi:helix-turn-helix domain-containing protein [Streptomyces sp. NPDC055722]